MLPVVAVPVPAEGCDVAGSIDDSVQQQMSSGADGQGACGEQVTGELGVETCGECDGAGVRAVGQRGLQLAAFAEQDTGTGGDADGLWETAAVRERLRRHPRSLPFAKVPLTLTDHQRR
jgi:hypothetical protein